MAVILSALLFVALHGLLLVRAATNVTVVVGLKGSFFDPPTTSAGVGDTITFIFAGFIHTVTQSSLNNPCLPLPGGFSSGFAGKLDNGSEPSQTWDLHITNASAPIYFFCEATQPTSHCGSGMVGMINPPSIDAYNSWRDSALGTPNTPAPAGTAALTGVGAFATQTPTIPPTPVSIPPPSSSTATDSVSGSQTDAIPGPTAQPAAAPAGPSPSHLGAIVGGAVGGAVVLVVLITVILWFLRQQNQTKAPPTPSSDDTNFFRYDPAPVRRPSEAFVEAKQLESLNSNARSQMSQPRTISPSPLAPKRRGGQPYPSAPPGVPQVMVHPQTPASSQMSRSGFEHGFDRQTSFNSLTTTSAPPSAVPQDQFNMHALANEVAVLLRNPSASTGEESLLIPEGRRRKNQERGFVDPVNRNESPLSPPAYRDTTTPERTGGNR